MTQHQNCGCDHTRLNLQHEEKVDDCPSCGAVAWTGEGSPTQRPKDALVCDACGSRVIAWMDEKRVTTLRRCLSCDDVVVMSA